MGNAFGLGRSIPADIKRAVRQRCGFGCVICGAAIYEYDHFEPDFAQATAHDEHGITLLCPSHHAQKTRGLLPLAVVRSADAAPAALSSDGAHVVLPYFESVPGLRLGGGLLVQNVRWPLAVDSVPILKFEPPEDGSRVTRLSCSLTDSDGEHLLKIQENEWRVCQGVWDYEWIGQRLTIRDAKRTVALQLTILPPHLIMVDRYQFTTGKLRVRITETEINVDGTTIIDGVNNGSRFGLNLFSRGGFAI